MPPIRSGGVDGSIGTAYRGTSSAFLRPDRENGPAGNRLVAEAEGPRAPRPSYTVLRTAIDELPDEHRATFLLHDVDGLSNCEIAETLQVKPATVKSRVHRARLFFATGWPTT